MSERVPDSLVSRIPSAESFISLCLFLPSIPSPSAVASRPPGEAVPGAPRSLHAQAPNPLDRDRPVRVRRDRIAELPA